MSHAVSHLRDERLARAISLSEGFRAAPSVPGLPGHFQLLPVRVAPHGRCRIGHVPVDVRHRAAEADQQAG